MTIEAAIEELQAHNELIAWCNSYQENERRKAANQVDLANRFILEDIAIAISSANDRTS
jgi:hypothetical protein